MQIEKLSASAFKLWDHCQMAYFIQYVLKWQFRPGKAADLGTITHAALETLAQVKLWQQKNEKKFDTDIGIIDVFNPNIDEIIDKTFNFYVNKPEYKNNVWSAKELKDIHKYVNVVLNHNNGQFNPLNKDIESTEQYINFQIMEPWAVLADGSRLRITGFVDLVTRVNQNTLEITDYKTGSLTDFHSGKAIDIDYAMKDIQLRLYHMALAEKFGCDNNYLLTLFYLKHSKPITITFDCNTLVETKEMIKDRFLSIFNTKIPKLNRSWKCTKFCEYGKNTFENTKIQPTIQFMSNGLAPVGKCMSICDTVQLEINRRSPEWVAQNLKFEK